MTAFGVHSEVGKLRQVIVHRPELSLERLTPINHDELLFDDVLWVERAQWEHDQFVARMRERDVEVLYVQDLLGEALAASEDARRRIIEVVARRGRRRTEPRRGHPGLPDRAGARGAGPPSDRRPDGRGIRARPREAARHVAHRGRHRRPVDVRPASPPQHAVHPRLVVLDLRRRLDQSDVLARPPARGLQHGGHLPRASAVPRTSRSTTGIRSSATTSGSTSRTSGRPPSRAATSRSSAAGRSRSGCPNGPPAG